MKQTDYLNSLYTSDNVSIADAIAALSAFKIDPENVPHLVTSSREILDAIAENLIGNSYTRSSGLISVAKLHALSQIQSKLLEQYLKDV